MNAGFLVLQAGHERMAPMILPDYTTDNVKKKQWTSVYKGTLR